jgi:hypothetical protein
MRAIGSDLDRKRLSARAIHNDIVATFGPNVVGYSTIMRYLHEAKLLLSIESAFDAHDRKPTDDAGQAIFYSLNKSPFASVQSSCD